ncbi:MAG TPA: hypothetical protein VM692_01605 [Gammaproteobacteria bacterium]|nr:hypothetical protein [Gammaproteobacteria bacterium]
MAFVIRVIASALLLASIAGGVTAQAPACDRRCLEGWIDRYLDALVKHDAKAVPLAATARYTENGQRLSVGDGLWRSVKAKGKYRLVVADTEAQQVAMIGTLEEQNADPEMGTPAVVALRLKIVGSEIAEVEQFIARNIDAAKRIEALGRPHPLFTQPIPEAERMSRADLIATANKYFTGMQQNDGKGDYPFAPDCNRIENGMQTTNRAAPPGEPRPNPATAANYSAQWSCREQFESGLLHFVTRIRDRRFVAVDPERGLVFSFVFFDHAAGDTRTFTAANGRQVTAGPAQPWTWYIAELFKIEKGQLRQIEATLERVPYGMTSGWSSWEDGMSDRPRDATR